MPNRFLFAVLVALSILGCGKQPLQSFTAPDGSFTIMMPGSPKERYHAVQSYGGKCFYLETGNEYYQVLYLNIPEGMEDYTIDAVLNTPADVMNSIGVIHDEKPFSSPYGAGKEFKVNIFSRQVRGYGRYFVANGRVYFLTLAREQMRNTASDAQRFFDSFQLHGQSASAKVVNSAAMKGANAPSVWEGSKAPSSPTSIETNSQTLAPTAVVFDCKVTTNAHSAVLRVLDETTGEILQSVALANGRLEYDFKLPGDRKVAIEAHAGGHALKHSILKNDHAQWRPMLFDDETIVNICRQATCVIRVPNGGHGSGFVLGDRHCIATAAHLLATRRPEELEILFDVGSSEVKYTGAHLIHYDGDRDVALLYLDQPLPQTRPFLHSQAPRDAEQVLVVGNPGRGDSIEWLLARPHEIKNCRLDEFEVGTEVLPGNGGGPITARDSTSVYGLLSLKTIDSADYKIVNVAFAEVSRVAEEARLHFLSLQPEQRVKEVTALSKTFADAHALRCADYAALNLVVDSALYAQACDEMANDFAEYARDQLARGSPGDIPRLAGAARNRTYQNYVKTRAPSIIDKVKVRVGKKLRREGESWVVMAHEHAELPSNVREQLQIVLKNYRELKQAAEQLVTLKQPNQGAAVDEFLVWTKTRWDAVRLNALEIHSRAVLKMQ